MDGCENSVGINTNAATTGISWNVEIKSIRIGSFIS